MLATMRENRTKKLLRDGKTAFGSFVRYPDPTLVEVMGYHGWDFFIFDGEHATLEPRSCENLVRAAELQGITPIVRVPVNQPHVILRLLDTGAQGAQVPWVQTPEDAERAVQSVKYQPRGARGLAGVRAADYGERGALGDYVQRANDETLVVVQVESATAVGHVEAIAATDAVDVVFLGPTDLSNSLGLPGELGHPAVVEHLERAATAIVAAGKVLGVTVSDAETAKKWMDRGARYVTTGVDPMLAAGTRSFLGALRA
jgi:4-hydroxy-2-oxoheptanedioate aldolase